MRGLGDPEVQEVLGHAATNTELDLTAIPKFIEAKETGKRSTGLISAEQDFRLPEGQIRHPAIPHTTRPGPQKEAVAGVVLLAMSRDIRERQGRGVARQSAKNALKLDTSRSAAVLGRRSTS